jgi:hypothetical protein
MRNKTMNHSYTAKPTVLMNSALLSGALALSLAAVWATLSVMLAA